MQSEESRLDSFRGVRGAQGGLLIALSVPGRVVMQMSSRIFGNGHGC
jgi:hypothetical protein